ncbi:MAG TPA: hypothetical protein VHN77_14445 [Phycisphaerales bacterium]|nr:hypothetical protein [Phycisphaerales bacterium]
MAFARWQLGVLAAVGGAAPWAGADIVVTRQAATIIVAGDDGTVQDFGPDLAPWSRSLTSGQPSQWHGDASLTTHWDADDITIGTFAAIGPGATTPVLTQSFVQVDIEFDLSAPATIEVRYDVTDGISVPPPPFVFTTTRIVDMTTFDELHTSPGVYVYTLPAGPFRLEVQNMLSNLDGQLEFTGVSTRTITGTVRILAPCDIDFNNDELFPDTQDIADLIAVFAGAECPTGPGLCDGIDFNGDGLFPDTQDIADFLTAFAGGAC